MADLGKAILGLGLVLALLGAGLILVSRTGLPLGRLPGDLAWRGRHVQFFFPVATCLILSVVVSLVLYLLSKISR